MANTENEHQFKELEKYAMFTPTPGVEGKRSGLRWGSWRGNPRITVFTNVPDDEGKGVINAPMNHETFGGLMLLMDNIIKGDSGRSFYVENYSLPKKEEGSTARREKFKVSETWVGKDANGMVWISVRAENRPEIVFQFEISDFHKIFKGNREPFSAPEASKLQAHSVMKALDRIFNDHAALLKPPYDPNAKAATNNGKPFQNKKPYPQTQKKEFQDLDDITF